MAEQIVTLQPGESKQVSFDATPNQAKVYQVSVDGLTGSFRATPAPTGILVTFNVRGENYKIFITNEETIDQVLAVQRGESHATIPNGKLIRGAVLYNTPWSWHIDSEDIHMVESSLELYDGKPSFVEADLDYWISIGRFAPWTAVIVNAVIVNIEDFR